MLTKWIGTAAKAGWVLCLFSSFIKLPEVSTQDANTLVDVNHYDISEITFVLFIVISDEVLIHLSFPTGADAASGQTVSHVPSLPDEIGGKKPCFSHFFTLPSFHVAKLLHCSERNIFILD